MASNGIRDRVAIVGMGCTPFGEHWDKSVDDLLIDASSEALNSASLPLDAVDAFWLGTLFSGQSGLTLSRPLKIAYKPVSRLENYCATGSEAFRNACYAVASGRLRRRHGHRRREAEGLRASPASSARAPPATAPARPSPPPPCSACSRRPTRRSTASTRRSSRK